MRQSSTLAIFETGWNE